MKISYNWLKELIDIDYQPEELSNILTMLGFEVEEIIDYKKIYDGFITAKVIKKEAHPDADKLSLCTVEYNGNSQTVICGAPNVREGLTIVLGLEGATVPSAGFKLSKRKIRGVESNGMICSQAELELGEDHSGIWELPDDAPVGIPLSEYLGMDDTIFDIFITPNRSDGNSHIGIAMELAAYSGKDLKWPEIEINESSDKIENEVSIEIENTVDCPHYMARVLKNVKIVESPDWIKQRLTAIGLRPRNIAVDATNLVLMETGNPLHAFDLDEINGNKIIVKNATDKQKFTTLDDKERELDSQMMMICDAERPVAIAGVMGGQNSEISDKTTNILIESAYFNPSSVRRTARKLSIHSDASYRFERGVDYERLQFAADRCAYLITKYGGGEIISGTLDEYPNKQTQNEIEVRYQRVRDIIGIEISNQEIDDFISRFKFEVKTKNDNSFTMLSPTWRVDLKIEIDVIEEIARLSNYDDITPDYRTNIEFGSENIPELLAAPKLRKKISSYLISRSFNECVTQNIIDPERAKMVNEEFVELSNALGKEMSAMRPGLIPSILGVVERNLKLRNQDLRLFEIGKVFSKTNNSKFIEGIKEEENLIIALSGNNSNLQWGKSNRNVDFYDIKGVLEDLLSDHQLSGIKFKENKDNKLFGVNSLSILKGKLRIGTFGEIDKKVLKRFDIDQNVMILEVNLSELYNIKVNESKYNPVSQFPGSSRDFAFVVKKEVEAGKILNLIDQNGGKYLNNYYLFDIYEGKGIGDDEKSLAFRLEFGSKDKTLTEQEIQEPFNKMIKAIEKQFDAKLRDN